MTNMEQLQHLLDGKTEGDWDLDKAFWAVAEGHGFPCPYYAEDWFADARQEPRYYPSAHMTTDMGTALAWLEENFEGLSWKMEREDGAYHIKFECEQNGYLICADRKVDGPARSLPLVIAQCAVDMSISRNRLRAEAERSPSP